METKELKEILEKHFPNLKNFPETQETKFFENHFTGRIIEAMQEVAKLSHNNAIRLASDSAEVVQMV